MAVIKQIVALLVLCLLLGGWRTGSQPTFFTYDGASVPVNSIPQGLYASDTNTSWFCWEGWQPVSGTSQRAVECATLNHGTGAWVGNYIAGIHTLSGDIHGAPSICRDPTFKHVYIFYGSHDSDVKITYTTNADDPSSWNDTTSLSATVYGPMTFPECFISGSTLYLMFANGSGVGNDKQSQLSLTTATINANGSLSWSGTFQVLFALGTDAWCLADWTAIPDGSGIAVVFSYKSAFNSPPTQNQYIAIYSFASGNVSNVGGATVIPPASQPINLTTANADFEVVSDATTYVGQMAIDNNGTFFLYYGTASTSPETLQETHYSGGSWSSPFTVFTYPSAVTTSVVGVPVVNATGGVDFYYADGVGSGNGQFAGNNGNMWRRTRSSGGSWTSPQLILGAQNYALPSAINMAPVANGSPNARVMIGEASSDDVTVVGNLRAWAYGDNGFLKRPWPWSVLNPQ